MLIGQVFQTDFHIIFIFQTVFQHVKLQDTHNAHDDLFHTGVELLEDLDGALLGDLVDALDELFSFHRIQLPYPGKMLRREGGNALIGELFPRCAHGISDGKNTRVENADDVTGISLVNDLPLLSHKLLRLGQAKLLATLHMVHFFRGIEFAGADAHESDPVSVGPVHVGLNLEYKGRKIL